MKSRAFGIAFVFAVASASLAAGPVLTVTGFSRQSSLKVWASACGNPDLPANQFVQSNDFANPGINLSGLASASVSGCFAQTHGAEYVGVESPVDGPVMTVSVHAASSCPPDTACPEMMRVEQEGAPPEGSYGLEDGSSSAITYFTLNEPANLTITLVYAIGAEVNGTFQSSSARASGGGTVFGPPNNLTLLDVFNRTFEIGGSPGIDGEDGTHVYTLMNAPVGAYAFSVGASTKVNATLPEFVPSEAHPKASSSVVAILHAAAVSAIVPGDINGDGVVNGVDLALVLGSWGPCAGCPADINGDGTVSGLDLAIVLGAWSP